MEADEREAWEAEDEQVSATLEALEWAVVAARDARKAAHAEWRRCSVQTAGCRGCEADYEDAVERQVLLEALVDKVRNGEVR